MSFWNFDTEELRALIQGKYKFHNCLECLGKGKVLVDGIHGIVVSHIPKDADKDDYYQDTCEDCNGLGGRLNFE